MALVKHKESIHSGQFMVSNFEADEHEDEAELGNPLQEDTPGRPGKFM